MLFCPYDGSLLLVENKTGTMAFFCQCCAYVQPIESMVSKKIIMEKKKVDDVLGGEDAWDNVDKTKIECEYGCGGKFAYFQQFQTRSADEPMTTFYRCVDCKKTWSEK